MNKLQSSIDIHVPIVDTWVGDLRRATVEVASLNVPPHVTILWPWKPAPVREDDIENLRIVASSCEDLEMTFDRIEHFPNRTIYLALSDEQPIRAIMQIVTDAFPDCPPYGGGFSDPVPHLTVAKALEGRSITELKSSLKSTLAPHLPLTIRCGELVVMEEGEDRMWNIRDRVHLSG